MNPLLVEGVNTTALAFRLSKQTSTPRSAKCDNVRGRRLETHKFSGTKPSKKAIGIIESPDSHANMQAAG